MPAARGPAGTVAGSFAVNAPAADTSNCETEAPERLVT